MIWFRATNSIARCQQNKEPCRSGGFTQREIEAIKFYAGLRPGNLAKKTVSEIVAKLLNARECDGRSAVYMKALKATLKRLVYARRRPDHQEII
jgi:hypothetical protein